MLSPTTRETLYVRLWSFLKIPALYFIRPKVVQMSSTRVVVRVRLRRRTKNHLGSMYFGVLCAGADCAGGLIAMDRIRDSGEPVSLIFKDFHAEFLKRAEADVDFICEDGEAISGLVRSVIASGEREHLPVRVTAVAAGEPVANFTLTLSLKKK